MRNKVKAKVCCLGLLFSLSLGSESKAIPAEEKNSGKSVQNALPSEKAVLPVTTPTALTADGNIPKSLNVDPLVTLEFFNAQKALKCESILKALNLDNSIANFLLLASIPWVGKDFSTLEECSKISIIFTKEKGIVVFKPTAEGKDVFLSALQNSKIPFLEQNGYLWVLLWVSNGNNDFSSAIPDIPNNEDLIKRATTSTTKQEDPFQFKLSLNANAIAESFPDDAPFFINFKTLEFTVELNDGIRLLGTCSMKPTCPNYAQLEKANYTKPLFPLLAKTNYNPSLFPLAFEQNENVRSYSVCRDVSWILDVVKLYIQDNLNLDKQVFGGPLNTVDDLKGSLVDTINDLKKYIAGTQSAELLQYGNDLVLFKVGETSCKVAEEYVSYLNRISDLNKKLTALAEKTKQTETPSVPVAADEKAEGKTGTKNVAGSVDGSKKPVKLVCEYKGRSIYTIEEYEEELFGCLTADYFLMDNGVLFSSSSLDFLKSRIDVLAAGKIPTENKTPTTTIETLREGVIIKGEVEIASLLRFITNTQASALKKYLPDASLARIDSDAKVSFEITAQGEGVVVFQLFVNNSCLKSLLIFVEIISNVFSHEQDSLHNGMVPAKANEAQDSFHNGMVPARANEAKTQNFIPAKKDDTQKNLSLIPKVACDVGTCREDRPILIPLKILTEYKIMG
ncbi:MAG: hypothetical protein LBF44_02150 [Holosporaceae bacterium]|nr:hypothetical protein [Holosporaceae bacterium]